MLPVEPQFILALSLEGGIVCSSLDVTWSALTDGVHLLDKLRDHTIFICMGISILAQDTRNIQSFI